MAVSEIAVLERFDYSSNKTIRMYHLEAYYGKPIKEIILEVCNSSPTMDIAAHRLGISRQRLYNWIERVGLTTSKRVVVA